MEHRAYRQEFAAKVAQEEEAAKAAHAFKARPNPFTNASVGSSASAAGASTLMQDVKSDKPLTVASTPALSSKERAAHRAIYDAELAERAAASEAAQAAQKALTEVKQAADVKVLRAAMKPVVGALNKAILTAPDFVAKPSTQKLTQPESPALITKRRANGGAALARKRMEQLEEEQPGAAEQAEEAQSIGAALADAAMEGADDQENVLAPLVQLDADISSPILA